MNHINWLFFFSHLPLFYFVSFFFLVWSASYANPQNIKMPSIYNLCSPFAFLCTNLTTSRSRTYTYTHLLHIQTTQNFVNEIPNDSCGVRFKYILSQWIFPSYLAAATFPFPSRLNPTLRDTNTYVIWKNFNKSLHSLYFFEILWLRDLIVPSHIPFPYISTTISLLPRHGRAHKTHWRSSKTEKKHLQIDHPPTRNTIIGLMVIVVTYVTGRPHTHASSSGVTRRCRLVP